MQIKIKLSNYLFFSQREANRRHNLKMFFFYFYDFKIIINFCCIICICKFASIKKDGGFFISAKEKKKLEALLEKSIKATPFKEKVNKLSKQNSKRKLEEVGIMEETKQKEENKEEDKKDDKRYKERDSDQSSINFKTQAKFKKKENIS